MNWMKRLTQLIFLAMILMVFTCGIVVCAEPVYDGKWDAKAITFVTGPSGGTHEVVGTAAAEILKKAIPGTQFSAVPSTGLATNPLLLQSRQGDVGSLSSSLGVLARDGQPPFKEPYPELCALFATYANVLQVWIPVDSNIKDLSDLKDKRFSFGLPGSTHYQPVLNLFEIYSISESDLKKTAKVQPLAWGAATNALRDNNIDALIWETACPAPAIQSIEVSRPYTLVQMDEKKLDEFASKYEGWFKVTIPAGTYKGQKEDVKTIATQNILAVDASMDPDLVYAMAKSLWENRVELGNTHATLKNISLDNVACNVGLKLHPGARKYFEEIGAKLD